MPWNLQIRISYGSGHLIAVLKPYQTSNEQKHNHETEPATLDTIQHLVVLQFTNQ